MVDYFNAELQYQIEKQDARPFSDINITQIYNLTLFALFGHITAVILTFIVGKLNFIFKILVYLSKNKSMQCKFDYLNFPDTLLQPAYRLESEANCGLVSGTWES